MLYWITGLAGAGKTTIGTMLYYDLQKKNDNVILLDGDILKKLLASELGYTAEERLERGKRYAQLCKFLVDQGMIVIICTIAMFDDIRDWNRENIDNYVEIFLDVPIEVLEKRNRKGLYRKQKKGELKNLTGVDITTQFPQNPDIVLKTDGSMEIQECLKIIKEYSIVPKHKVNDDKKYWNQFYKKNKSFHPSKFARDIIGTLGENKMLLELGCGNGRDSEFFAQNGLHVTAIDASSVAIEELKLRNQEMPIDFICDDFVKSKNLYQKEYDYIYCRFVLHAITSQQQNELLNNVYGALKEEGKLFIEVRSIHDKIYGLGKKVGENAYIYNKHYRRFLDINELKQELENKGFCIYYIEESDIFSPQDNDRPMLIRVIAGK